MRLVALMVAFSMFVIAGAAGAQVTYTDSPPAAFGAAPQSNLAHPSGIVVCESQNNQPARCRVPNSWRGARLVQQVSQVACVEGRTWGFDFGSVWVTQGCRGRFGEASAGGTAPPNAATVQCESNNNQTNHCRTPAYWSGAALAQQLSQTACVEGRNWGFDRGYIWVNGGCRGRFMQAATSNPGANVLCESTGNRQQRCRVPTTWRAAQLVQQLSNSACTQGRTWGFEPGSVWVSGGCRGRFAEAVGWQPGPGWNQDFVVSCASPQHRYRFCEVDVGANGHVTLQRQTSSARCIQGTSWGWNRAGIWVNNGCAGEFMVRRRW